jgi:hypothetical protein
LPKRLKKSVGANESSFLKTRSLPTLPGLGRGRPPTSGVRTAWIAHGGRQRVSAQVSGEGGRRDCRQRLPGAGPQGPGESEPLLSFGSFPAHSKSSKWRAPPNPTKDFWEPLSSAPNRIGRSPTAAVSTSKAAGCKRIDGEEAFIRLNAKTERHLPEF